MLSGPALHGLERIGKVSARVLTSEQAGCSLTVRVHPISMRSCQLHASQWWL